MKVVQFSAYGPPEQVVECVEVADPGAPGPDEVVFDVLAFPINPADLLLLEGRYAIKPPLPARLGAECVGRVVAVGENVSTVAVGDRVLHRLRDNWAQAIRAAAEAVIVVPGDLDPLQAAMLKVNPPTAQLMLERYVDLQPGDWVIQDAANSGVGSCLIRLARANGWRTVNVVRRPELIDPLRALGGDVVVVDGDDLADRVAAAVGEGPVRLGIDAIGGEMVLRLADCLAEGGTIVNYGLLSGQPCMLGSEHLVFRQLTLTGFWLMAHLQKMDLADIHALYAGLAKRVGAGELDVAVEATYPIEEIKAAAAHANRPGRAGKILVTPNGPID